MKSPGSLLSELCEPPGLQSGRITVSRVLEATQEEQQVLEDYRSSGRLSTGGGEW